MKTYAIANIKGGSAKSTTAVHLSDALSRFGKGLLIDMDPQADATDFLWPDASLEELNKGNTMSLLRGETTLDESLHPSLFVDLIPAIIDLADLSSLTMRQPAILSKLKKALAKTSYAWAVIDTPGAIGAELTASLIAADVILIPVTPSKWAVRAVMLLLRELENARDKKAPAYVIPVMFGKSERDLTILSMLEELPGIKKILPTIPKSSAIQNRTEANERLKETSTPGQSFADLAKVVNKL